MDIFAEASARILKLAISRPQYDNRRLGDRLNWVMDNWTACKDYYNALGEALPNCWDDEAWYFCCCQYDQQILAKYNDQWENAE